MPDYYTYYIPLCPECRRQHDTRNVECVDVEEDIHGSDTLTYICPRTKGKAKSKVYREVRA